MRPQVHSTRLTAERSPLETFDMPELILKRRKRELPAGAGIVLGMLLGALFWAGVVVAFLGGA